MAQERVQELEFGWTASAEDSPPPPPHEVINIIRLIKNIFLWCILMNSRLLLIGVKINNLIRLIFF